MQIHDAICVLLQRPDLSNEKTKLRVINKEQNATKLKQVN